MLEKIFSRAKKKEGGEQVPELSIQFGRYSDNNKPVIKVKKWNEAEVLSKKKSGAKALLLFLSTCVMTR